MLDQHCRYFSILVYRELPAKEGPQSIPSSQLYFADYLFQSSYSSFGSLFGCYPCHTTQLPLHVLKTAREEIRTHICQILILLQQCKGLQFEATWEKYKDDPNLGTLAQSIAENATQVV